MDAVTDIKARLPIEELVASYCTLQRKGRNFVCLCPFHNDAHPSFLVSPDKGIAYCFACQTGGDIFSFYQAIEGVDFAQALKELGERTGVKIEQHAPAGPKKDEKERARDCLLAALQFYRTSLSASDLAKEYVRKRHVSPEQIEQFEIGVAPDSFSQTYEHLLKSGFSRKEILAAGLGVQRELQEEKIYDRFRHRLMFPIHDSQGGIVGFGGRTLGDDDAKYINSSDGILFHKSNLLYGLHFAREAIRTSRSVILVEGYFDVLACHKAGAHNVVATCGTALTPEHVKLLRRYADTVTLCMDQDRAGQDAMERSYSLLAPAGLNVDTIVLPGKDPSDILSGDPALLAHLLQNAASPYLDVVIEQTSALDLTSPAIKKEALRRVLRLLSVLPTAVERSDYLRKASAALGTSELALEEDLRLVTAPAATGVKTQVKAPVKNEHPFSAAEVALGIILAYPTLRHLLSEMIPPEDPMPAALFAVLLPKEGQDGHPHMELLPAEHRVQVGILQLFCEQHGFTQWSESMAAREIHKNIVAANRDMLRMKQQQITMRLLQARREGSRTDEAQLQTQYEQLLKLMRKAV